MKTACENSLREQSAEKNIQKGSAKKSLRKGSAENVCEITWEDFARLFAEIVTRYHVDVACKAFRQPFSNLCLPAVCTIARAPLHEISVKMSAKISTSPSAWLSACLVRMASYADIVHCIHRSTRQASAAVYASCLRKIPPKTKPRQGFTRCLSSAGFQHLCAVPMGMPAEVPAESLREKSLASSVFHLDSRTAPEYEYVLHLNICSYF